MRRTPRSWLPPVSLLSGARTRWLSGAIHVDPSSAGPIIYGSVHWHRGAAQEVLEVNGGPYHPPLRGKNVFGTSQSAFAMSFTASGLATTNRANLTLNSASAVTQTSAGAPYVQMTFSPANGLFTGKVMLNNKPLLVPFIGLLHSNAPDGLGIVGSGAMSGRVRLTPPGAAAVFVYSGSGGSGGSTVSGH